MVNVGVRTRLLSLAAVLLTVCVPGLAAADYNPEWEFVTIPMGAYAGKKEVTLKITYNDAVIPDTAVWTAKHKPKIGGTFTDVDSLTRDAATNKVTVKFKGYDVGDDVTVRFRAEWTGPMGAPLWVSFDLDGTVTD